MIYCCCWRYRPGLLSVDGPWPGEGTAVVMTTTRFSCLEIDCLNLWEESGWLLTTMTGLGEMLLDAVDMPCQRFEGQQNVMSPLGNRTVFYKRDCSDHHWQSSHLFWCTFWFPKQNHTPGKWNSIGFSLGCNLIDTMCIYSKSLVTEQIPLTGILEDLIV